VTAPDGRVAGFLGRILDDSGAPRGTCFQLDPAGIAATAWHVLDDLGAGEVGAAVTVDPLQGGDSRAAVVVAADPVHDLAVLRLAAPLAATVAGLQSTDEVALHTDLVVTALADVQTDRHLDSPGRWAGGTIRDDQVPLGRMLVDRVQRGMGGAPVLTADLRAVGVVSARYNGIDGWLRDSVWVARTENLAALLAGVSTLAVTQRPRTGSVELGSTGEMLNRAARRSSPHQRGRSGIPLPFIRRQRTRPHVV
jgi:hypothetical protein